MVMRYESIRSELSLPSLQALWQNCFGILEKGAECKLWSNKRHNAQRTARLQGLVQDYGLFETLDRDHFYPSVESALADIDQEAP